MTKLGTATVGSGTKPIYLNAGSPTASSSTVGGSNQPAYLSSGTITAGNTFVPNSGGTFSGRVIQKGGTTCYYSGGTSGTSGYVLMCTITSTSTYGNMDLAFHITQRSRHGTVYLRFSNTNASSGWSVSSLTQDGNVNAYVSVASSTVFNFYIQKSESYDSISVNMLELGDYQNSRCTIDWVGTQADSLPSSYTASSTAQFGNTTYGGSKQPVYLSSGTVTTCNSFMSLTGDTFTGLAYAQTNTSYTTYQLRNIAFTTSTPSSLTNGYVCMVYS